MGLGRYKKPRNLGAPVGMGRVRSSGMGAGRRYSDHNYFTPPGVKCLMPQRQSTDGAYVIDQSVLDLDPPGNEALTLVSGDVKVVFGIFWGPHVANTYGLKVGKFGEVEDIQEVFVKPVAETIAAHTVGNVRLVGGSGSTTPDVVVVGELPSAPCGGQFNWPTYCMCFGSGGLGGMARDWFSNNGYSSSEYDVKIAIMLHCTGTNELITQNIWAPYVAMALNPDMGETSFPPIPGVPGETLDVTNYKSLSDGHVIEQVVHQIHHMLGIEHSRNTWIQTGGAGKTTDGICFNRHKADGPTLGCTEQPGQSAGQYSIDSINIVNQFGYFNNYKLYKELHPSAAQKHLVGTAPGQTPTPWIPDSNVVTLEVGDSSEYADEWEGYLWAHDRPGPLEDPTTQQILDNNDALLIKIRRDARRAELEEGDTLGTRRYYYLSYRRNAAWSVPFHTTSNTQFEHGALMLEWGPTCAFCDSSWQSQYSVLVLAKAPIMVPEVYGNSPLVFESYGLVDWGPTEWDSPPVFPKLEIRILDHDYNDSLQGGDWIKIRITQALES